jgi:hypothetical protein
VIRGTLAVRPRSASPIRAFARTLHGPPSGVAGGCPGMTGTTADYQVPTADPRCRAKRCGGRERTRARIAISRSSAGHVGTLMSVNLCVTSPLGGPLPLWAPTMAGQGEGNWLVTLATIEECLMGLPSVVGLPWQKRRASDLEGKTTCWIGMPALKHVCPRVISSANP